VHTKEVYVILLPRSAIDWLLNIFQ